MMNWQSDKTFLPLSYQRNKADSAPKMEPTVNLAVSACKYIPTYNRLNCSDSIEYYDRTSARLLFIFRRINDTRQDETNL